MLLCNNYFLIGCRSHAVVDRYSSFAMPFIFSIFGISRQTDIHICDCSCKVIEFFEFFCAAVDFDLRFPAHLRVFIRRHMHNLYKMCSSKICPNAFVSKRSFGVFATFALFCNNPQITSQAVSSTSYRNRTIRCTRCPIRAKLRMQRLIWHSKQNSCA